MLCLEYHKRRHEQIHAKISSCDNKKCPFLDGFCAYKVFFSMSTKVATTTTKITMDITKIPKKDSNGNFSVVVNVRNNTMA